MLHCCVRTSSRCRRILIDRAKMGVITMDPVEIKEQRSVVAALGTVNADQGAALVDS